MDDGSGGGSARRKNVVFIFADEWRGQATGYAGDVNARTPNLDGFARESVNLVNAGSGCSVCCPYRGSLLTGQYPQTHGVIINDVELRPGSFSIARAFGAAGYETGYIGKWHVYGSPGGGYERGEVYVPREYQMGFDYWKGFECCHDYNESYYFFNEDATRRRWEGYDAFAQCRDAAEFIRGRAGGERPFLLMVSLGAPHFPLHTAPERYRKRYEGRALELRPNVPAAFRGKAQEDLRGYYAHIAAVDDAFAMVRDAIDAAGIAEDTIFVFTADHGDMMRSQGLNTKLYPWEESVSVPFLMRHPGVKGSAGTTCAAPLDAPDIMPTLLGLCGIGVPGSVEGRDWSGVIEGRERLSGEEALFLNMTAEYSELQWMGIKAYRGLRTMRHTYVRNIEGPWLLYDNLEDPYQMRNLIGEAGHAEVRGRLEARLQRELRERRDEFLPSEVYLERAGLMHYKEVQCGLVRKWEDPWRG